MLGYLNQDQIDQLLRSEVVGRLGCSGDGRTYVVPVTYCYEDGYVWGHTSEGLKTRLARQNPNVCFEVDHIDGMANWRSVIVQGRYEELSGELAAKAMELLMTRLMPLITSESAAPSHGLGSLRSDTPDTHRAASIGHDVVVYRIKPDHKSGRYEKR